MDLQTLQGQLKTAIQNHQIVVSKMRNDPQNISLKKQLHDLQAEIMTLSEKQKQVVQQLRKELEKKQQVVIVSGSNQLPANQSSLLHSTLTQKSSQSIIVTQSAPVQTQPVALTNKQMTIVQSGSQTVRHIVPSVLSSLVTSSTNVSIKAPVATAVLFSHGAPTTNALLTARSSNQQRTQPVLVVPSPNARPNETSQTGVMLNLTPPIRVPQYPPPGSRSVLTVPTACHSVTTSTTTTTTSSSSSSSHNISKKMPSSPHSVSKPASMHNKVVNKEKQIKTDFMSTLGLVTKDFLTELKSRKSERKRRTTANPQFSNAALEEKRKNAAFLNAENSQGPPVKRPRGRPRLAPPTPNSSGSLSPENNMSSVTNVSLPTPVSTVSVIATLTAVTALASTSSTANSITVAAAATMAATTATATATTTTITTTTTSTNTVTTTNTSNSALYSSGGTNVVNGYHIPQQSLGPHPVKETLQEHCTVCKQKGNLLKCSVCAGFFHSSCLQSPVLVALTGAWTCNKCSKPEIKSRATTWPSPLPVVHSYIALKAVKEEEKRKLLKRSLELKSERTQLQDRMQQLNEVINDQTKRRTDLQATYQIMQKSIECLQDFITKIKQMS